MTQHTLTAGPLTVTVSVRGNVLHAVEFPTDVPDQLDSAALDELAEQLAGYELWLEHGGLFTRSVWQRLREIPRGSALTYRELAVTLGKPLAVRAVGQACARNRLLLAIPCHRVVAEDGLGGFALGLDWKRKLLELESEALAA